MLQRCLSLSAIIKRTHLPLSWRAASNATAMRAKELPDSLSMSLPGAHLRPVDAKPIIVFNLGSSLIVSSLEVTNRNARRPKKANHGTRAVCHIRRRANVSSRN